MPVVNVPTQVKFSDLVFHEIGGAEGYTRDMVNVTPPAEPVVAGTVFFRVKSVDPQAPYAKVEEAADVALANEYVVVFGDEYAFNPGFVPHAITAGEYNAVGWKRGPIQIKDYWPKQNHPELSATEFDTLKQVLADQGVILELTC